jgi:hypothetical protein
MLDQALARAAEQATERKLAGDLADGEDSPLPVTPAGNGTRG